MAVFGSLLVVTLSIVLTACGSGRRAGPGSSSGPSPGQTAKTTTPHASPTIPRKRLLHSTTSSPTTTTKPSATSTSVAGAGSQPRVLVRKRPVEPAGTAHRRTSFAPRLKGNLVETAAL